jgi:hypothetical protein
MQGTEAMNARDNRGTLTSDLLLALGLVALIAAARLMPHVPGFWPATASALFAGAMMRNRALAVATPLAAMLVSDAVIGFDQWQLTIAVYASLAVAAAAGMASRQMQARFAIIPVAVACSLLFFVTTNLAVWAFSDLYPRTLDGLAKCFVAAIPFLEKTLVSDLFWVAVLFGGAWLVQNAPALLARRPLA